MWRERALSETRQASRTWFGTLTLRPQEQVRALARCRQRLARQGIDFDALDYGDQFRERVRALSPLLTLWIKRVRKQSGAALRYILVAEHHQSGLPHFHCLVHEVEAGRPVRYDDLFGQWVHGHAHFKLVGTEEAASYAVKVCGYVSKCAAARVRASAHYGNGRPMPIVAEVPFFRGVRGDVPPEDQKKNGARCRRERDLMNDAGCVGTLTDLD